MTGTDKGIYQTYLGLLRQNSADMIILIQTKDGNYRTFDQNAVCVGSVLGLYPKLISGHRTVDLDRTAVEALIGMKLTIIDEVNNDK